MMIDNSYTGMNVIVEFECLLYLLVGYTTQYNMYLVGVIW